MTRRFPSNDPAPLIIAVAMTAIGMIDSSARAQQSEQPPALTPEQIAELTKEPPSHLAPMPEMIFDSAGHRATVDDEKEVAAFIEQLIQIDKPDYGMAPMMSGWQFAPVKSSREFGAGIIMVDHGLETSPAIERLVAEGPKAIVALLRSLDDPTPSKLIMNWEGVMGSMSYGHEIALNPANPREQRVRDAHPDLRKPGWDMGDDQKTIEKYTVTRGDISFMALGQIVNRCYQPTRYQPTSCMVINSPTHDPELARIVRELWTSDDPARMLFESLMTDFHSRGGAASYQIGAAMRLLYYFPRESRDIIIKRLDDLGVRRIVVGTDDGWDAWRKQKAANGEIEEAEFIKAVSFSTDPGIIEAILRLAGRTDDPSILSECLTEAVVKTDPDLTFRRMQEVVAVAPPAEQGPFGGEYYILMKAAAFAPDRARALFDMYLRHNTLATRRAVIHALEKPPQPVPWAADFLRPLLDDKTDTLWRYGPDYDRKPIRVCDEAAQTLTSHVAGATFKLDGDESDLDRQIDDIKKRIAGEPVETRAVVTAPSVDWNSVPIRAPVASFEIDQELGGVYGISDDHLIVAGFGYAANCWAYDTLMIDAVAGRITSRMKLDEWKGAVEILRPCSGELAMCYHGESDGRIIVRDVRTGVAIRNIATPFHDGVSFDDPLQVRCLSDIFVSGDERWALAMTPDASLHSVNLQTGEHKKVWQREGKSKFGGPMSGSLTPVLGTNRFLVEFFAEDDPLRIWDQDQQTMTEVTKVPSGAWRNAWGRYALNHLNNNLVFWDLQAKRPITLPLDATISVADITCDHQQSAVIAATLQGPICIVRLPDNQPVARLDAPKTSGRVSMVLSNDDRWLFWTADLTQRDRKTGESSNQRTQMAVFNVAGLTH